MPLSGQHAFVTGGGRGIGRAIAAALARAGAAVTVIGRSEAPLRAAVAAGAAAGCAVADVTDAAALKRQVSAAEAARGPIAILVNNAGWVASGPFSKADASVFRSMWDVHVMGAVHATQAVLPGMIAAGFGRIVNVASIAGLKGYAYVSAYCAAKHALVGLTRALAAASKVAERPHDHKDELRLWLRLFACKEVIEGAVRRRLRENFDVTLPRFDLMSQLYRAPKAMPLGELSQRMMVSNGNVTGLVDRLVEQGLINRQPSPKDRRAQLVSLTAEGRRFFRAMARANADWIADMLVDLSSEEIDTLMRLLAKTKASARKAIGNGGPR